LIKDLKVYENEKDEKTRIEQEIITNKEKSEKLVCTTRQY
jgi:hypothetical protein